LAFRNLEIRRSFGGNYFVGKKKKKLKKRIYISIKGFTWLSHCPFMNKLTSMHRGVGLKTNAK
jgi:hypothetical protein